MKKNNLFMLIIGSVNFAVCLTLLFLCVPDQIAIAIDINEKITATASKWVLLINVFIPLLLAILSISLSYHKKTNSILAIMFLIFLYENILAFSYFSINSSFEIGELSEIPVAVSLFMPVSIIISYLGLKLKTATYNKKFGIRTKYSVATEFIWKHTHFYASNAYFGCGVFLFLISIIFMFVRLPYIELILLATSLITVFVLSNNQAKKMYKKYVQMESNKNRIDKIKLSNK